MGAQIQLETHGALRWYTKFLILNGPLYMLFLGSLVLWVQLGQSPICATMNPEMYARLKIYASCAFFISVFFHVMVHWHNKVIHVALHTYKQDLRRAPPGTLRKLSTVAYDEAVFGDETGKRYPSECPICLAAWEQEDVIKVTPCDHAFHEECLGQWLKTQRTCALCRQDVTKRIARQSISEGVAEIAFPEAAIDQQVVGARSALPNDAL